MGVKVIYRVKCSIVHINGIAAFVGVYGSGRIYNSIRIRYTCYILCAVNDFAVDAFNNRISIIAEKLKACALKISNTVMPGCSCRAPVLCVYKTERKKGCEDKYVFHNALIWGSLI